MPRPLTSIYAVGDRTRGGCRFKRIRALTHERPTARRSPSHWSMESRSDLGELKRPLGNFSREMYHSNPRSANEMVFDPATIK